MELLRKARQLPVALEALGYLTVSQVAILLPAGLLLSPAVRQALGPAGEGRSTRFVEAQRLVRVSNVLLRFWPFNSRCLQRSLVVLWLLRRRGIAAELKIGVRWEEVALLGHAWVEVAGRPVNDTAAHCAEFRPLLSAHEFARWRRNAKLAS